MCMCVCVCVYVCVYVCVCVVCVVCVCVCVCEGCMCQGCKSVSSLVSRPTLFCFVLQSLTIIHGSGRWQHHVKIFSINARNLKSEWSTCLVHQQMMSGMQLRTSARVELFTIPTLSLVSCFVPSPSQVG